MSEEAFGCEHCWPASPDEAWAGFRALKYSHELLDESHLGISIRECSRCNQQFVAVFLEFVDWVDGDDPQYWTLLPVTRDEAAGVIQRGGRELTAALNAVGPHRRSLEHAHPKGEEPRNFWGTGLHVH